MRQCSQSATAPAQPVHVSGQVDKLQMLWLYQSTGLVACLPHPIQQSTAQVAIHQALAECHLLTSTNNLSLACYVSCMPTGYSINAVAGWCDCLCHMCLVFPSTCERVHCKARLKLEFTRKAAARTCRFPSTSCHSPCGLQAVAALASCSWCHAHLTRQHSMTAPKRGAQNMWLSCMAMMMLPMWAPFTAAMDA